MATVPRPLSADIASTVAIGPKASHVTMRMSNASDAGASAFRRGTNNGSAISADGMRKKAWLTANCSGCQMWSIRPRDGKARCSA